MLKAMSTTTRYSYKAKRSSEQTDFLEVLFEQVLPGFFSDLKNQFPELGNAELKLCALTLMNLSLKESSQILGISPKRVKTSRHRLKKKLNLDA